MRRAVLALILAAAIAATGCLQDPTGPPAPPAPTPLFDVVASGLGSAHDVVAAWTNGTYVFIAEGRAWHYDGTSLLAMDQAWPRPVAGATHCMGGSCETVGDLVQLGDRMWQVESLPTHGDNCLEHSCSFRSIERLHAYDVLTGRRLGTTPDPPGEIVGATGGQLWFRDGSDRNDLALLRPGDGSLTRWPDALPRDCTPVRILKPAEDVLMFCADWEGAGSLSQPITAWRLEDGNATMLPAAGAPRHDTSYGGIMAHDGGNVYAFDPDGKVVRWRPGDAAWSRLEQTVPGNETMPVTLAVAWDGDAFLTATTEAVVRFRPDLGQWLPAADADGVVI